MFYTSKVGFSTLTPCPVFGVHYKLNYLRGFGGQHKGVDVQALWTWENCEEETSRGKGEPVCTPIKGKILRVDVEPQFRGKDENGNPKRNPHAGKISGIIIVEVDKEGNPVENGHVIGLRHMEHMINPNTGQTWKRGDAVNAGTQIGTMSDIGSPGAIHLHFEVGTGIYRYQQTSLVNPSGSAWLEWWSNTVWSLPAWIDRVFPNWGISCPPEILGEEEEEEEEEEITDPLILNLDGNGTRRKAGVRSCFLNKQHPKLSEWGAATQFKKQDLTPRIVRVGCCNPIQEARPDPEDYGQDGLHR